MPPRIPSYYRLAFTWYDPLVTLWGAYLELAHPAMVVDAFAPNTPRNPDLDLFFQQLAGFTLALCFLEVVLLRATDDLRTWRIFQWASLIVDAFLLYSSYWGLSRQGRLAPAAWRKEDWGCLFITGFATVNRCCFLAGVGFR